MHFISSEEASSLSLATLGNVSRPWGPRQDKYVWAGKSCRSNGCVQEPIGSKYSFALYGVDGSYLGRVVNKAWASPLACPLP